MAELVKLINETEKISWCLKEVGAHKIGKTTWEAEMNGVLKILERINNEREPIKEWGTKMEASELIKEGGKQATEIKNFTHANAMLKRHLLELHKFVKMHKIKS